MKEIYKKLSRNKFINYNLKYNLYFFFYNQSCIKLKLKKNY